MRKLTLVCMALLLVAGTAMAAGSAGTQGKHFASGQNPGMLYSSAPSGAKVDTLFVIGNPDGTSVDKGTFQHPSIPNITDAQGWTSVDLTLKTESKWHVDTFNAELLDAGSPNNAMYCGEVFAACSESDAPEGYGHSYKEYIDWWGTVTDAGAATTVTVSGILNYDNEPGYDYLYLRNEDSNGWNDVTFWNGTNYNTTTLVFEPVSFTFPIPYAANTYVGVGFNEVHLRFAGESDGAWDDADCLWPTSGLAQLDNVAVSGDNGLTPTTDDFESGMAGSNWEVAFPQGVGDFAKVWSVLQSLDPCTVNNTAQFAFIDDGVVEDCNGEVELGTLGQTWTYGPDGYVVNLLGGCAGPTEHLDNQIWSPQMTWPAGQYSGAEYSFACYSHVPLANGLFYVWSVRTYDSVAGTWTGWNDDNFVYYSNDGIYARRHFEVTAHLAQETAQVQLSLGAYELGYIWGFNGTDGTPAPYFDNVALRVYPVAGPFITTRELEMFQDSFPENGIIDVVPGNNDIRLDMANDIVGDDFPEIVPGDSATFSITAVNSGTTLDPLSIEMHFAMAVNPQTPILDRANLTGIATATGTVVGPDGLTWDIYEGVVAGQQVTNDVGPIPDRFFFSPPDVDFFYPGDVMHYYITANDGVEDGFMPVNRDGYGVFFDKDNPDYVYSSSFTLHGLPTLYSAGGQPDMLFWNDFANRGAENEWYFALSQNGYHRGEDYDVYYTNAPSSGVSNGLGANATDTQLAGYTTMLYTAGNLGSYTLAGNVIDSEKSDDLLLVDTWLKLGGKNFFCTGDNMVRSLVNEPTGAIGGPAFISTWFSVNYVSADVAATIGNQTAPVVTPVTAALSRDFVAYGACPSINLFDEITLAGTAVALAEFTLADGVTPSGVPAVIANTNFGSNVIMSIVDFGYWFTPDSQTGAYQAAARTNNLADILVGWGHKGAPTGAPAAKPFFARNYPNPFNPITKIEFSVPKAGPVSVKIFNVRGELVRTLVNETMEASELVVREWNGTNDRNEAVASGVYFYETRTNGNVAVNKMALVK
jgi:hypothetical protein